MRINQMHGMLRGNYFNESELEVPRLANQESN
jgi:hypothetical protein